MARQLRDRLYKQSDELKATVDGICKPLRRRWEQHRAHKVRAEVLFDAVRDWQEKLPAFGRFGQVHVEWNKKNDLALAECRLLSGDLLYEHWEGARESSIGAEIVTLIINPKRFSLTYETHAIFSLHALARRFERGSREVDDVLADMQAIIPQRDRLLNQQAREFEAQVASGGRWAGDRVTASLPGDTPSKTKVLSVRTYLPPGMLSDFRQDAQLAQMAG